MSNYTKTTNFAAKDSLPSGNAGKIVKGTEIDAEFNNIATASATKADINDATLTGTTTFGSLNDGTITITGWVDEDNMSSNSAVLVPTQQSVKAYVDTNVTAQDLDVTDGSTSIDIDLDSESLGILGGTGVTSTASGTGVTLAIDSTVATLTGTQTLTNKTLTTPTILTSFTIGSATISEAELEILDGATVTTAELNVLDGITSTTAELNILDGVTSTAAEINILDGVTSTTAELNKLDGFTGTVADLNYAKDLNATGVTASEFDILDGLTATTAELNILDGVTSTTAELNILDGVTATTAELNILDGVTSTAAELNILDGVTSTTAELNILDGVTSTATELNLLDGVTATTAELNYTDGVTSAIQTQLDGKISGTDAALTGNVTITTADDTTQLALISTSADANAGPVLDLFRNSVSAADNDLTGQVYFSGRNDADEKTYYGQITSQITDVSNGSEDFALELSTLTAGSSNSRLFIGPTETVFNETSADLDFRIESDGNENAFFLEGSSGNTGIGIASSYKLTVNSGATTETTAAAIGYNGDAGTNLYINTDHGNNLVSLYASGDVSKEMRFLSGTLEVMRLDTSGRVGIGTSSPSLPLHVKSATSGLPATSGTTQTNGVFRLSSTATSGILDFGMNGTNPWIQSTGSDGLGATYNLLLNPNGGNVGIGTNSPTRTFHSKGASGISTVGKFESGSSQVYIQLSSSGQEVTDSGYIGYSSSKNLTLFTADTERMRIDASGNVGIASGRLRVAAGDDEGTQLNAWTTAGGNGNVAAFNLVFNTGANSSRTERMRIDSSGRVGIGTASPDTTLHLQTPSGTKSEINFAQTAVTNYRIGVPASTDALVFTYGASTERMRIDSSGNLLVGATSNLGFSGVVASHNFAQTTNGRWIAGFRNATTGTPWGIAMQYSATAPNNTSSNFLYLTDSAGLRCSVMSNGGVQNYQSNDLNLSDRREKTNFLPAKSYLDAICAIPVQTFNYIDQNMEEDPSVTLGVVAQDVQPVAPELVKESNWGTEEDPKMRLSIYQTDFQYALMKCIQEQQATIEALTTRLTALENN